MIFFLVSYLNAMILKFFKIYEYGILIYFSGVAQVKINGKNQEMLRAAGELFGGKTEDEITEVAKLTMEGHQRAVMGTMTVEQIYKDRKMFATKVLEIASEGANYYLIKAEQFSKSQDPPIIYTSMA